MKSFKYELGTAVGLTDSDERGVIEGRADYPNSEDQYYVTFKLPDGNFKTVWYDESRLTD